MKTAYILCIFLTSALSAYSQDSLLVDHRDGQFYKIVSIGTDVWMQENLRFQHDSGKYKKGSKKINKFGNFYNRTAINELCPDGWHIPLLTEWDNLIKHLVADNKIPEQELLIEVREEKLKFPKRPWEKYFTRFFIDNSNKLDLFGAPLYLNPFGWIQKGRRFKKLGTANIWIVDNEENLVNFHIHAGPHNFNSHSHKHHIDDSKARRRFLSVRCVMN